jgi:hypothetical protein
LHFGLGDRQKLQHVEVQWLGGRTELFSNLPVDQRVTLVEGTGKRP